jgi:hypothetical protein
VRQFILARKRKSVFKSLSSFSLFRSSWYLLAKRLPAPNFSSHSPHSPHSCCLLSLPETIGAPHATLETPCQSDSQQSVLVQTLQRSTRLTQRAKRTLQLQSTRAARSHGERRGKLVLLPDLHHRRRAGEANRVASRMDTVRLPSVSHDLPPTPRADHGSGISTRIPCSCIRHCHWTFSSLPS